MVTGGWDDFSNNLATDLTPLISLFGEQPTKQFLSESTTLTDIFIFSMAPLGVLTAVVSAVRAGGTPSLRAFIGRAQEGGATVEIELCSSTSRDVCEMYNNGGISRVLGRPKIIEIVQDTRATNEEFYNGGTAGLYFFKDYIQKERGQNDWKETTLDNSLRYRKKLGTEKASDAPPSGFAPNPNLSLNIGIKKPHFLWFIAAALCGFLLQSAVMVFAALTTYRLRDQFKKDDAHVADYAFPCTLIGTVLLSLGVGLCAYVVTKTSKQRVFRKQPDCSSRLFWIQPGNQIIGDQVFDSFAFSESLEKPMTEYTTKWKKNQRKKKSVSILVWSAISLSICGFVLQFLGLRALHSSVSVAQLGVMVVMSAVRAGLRTRRMDIEDSPISQDPEFYEGHELDWVAFDMGRAEIRSSLSFDSSQQGYSSPSGLQGEEEHTIVFQVVGFPKLGRAEVNKEPVHHDWQWDYDSYSMVEIQRLSIINEEGELPVELLSGLTYNDSNKRPVHFGESERERLVKDCRVDLQKTKAKDFPRLLPRIFLWRTRLSEMTSNWEEKHAPVREIAMSLKKAIEGTATAIFDRNVQDPSPTLFKKNWKDVLTIFWPVECQIVDSNRMRHCGKKSLNDRINFKVSRGLFSRWVTSSSDLEALLSMWVWSIQSLFRTEVKSQENCSKYDPEQIQCYRVFSPESDDVELGVEVWLDHRSSYFGNRTFYPATPRFEPTFCHASDGIPCWVFRCNSLEDWYPTQPENDDLVLNSYIHGSATRACAQEIYTIFIRAVLQAVLDIGGKTKVKDSNELVFSNTNVERICDAFTGAELGDRMSALDCVIPALYSRKLLPPQRMLSTVRRLGERCQMEGNYKKAQQNLLWVYRESIRLVRRSDEMSSTATNSRAGESLSSAMECDIKLELQCSVFGLCQCFLQQVVTGKENPALYLIQMMLEDNTESPKIFKMIAVYARICGRFLKAQNVDTETLESIERILRKWNSRTSIDSL